MSTIKKYIMPILLILFATMYPVIFMYCKNIAETSFCEVVGILVAYVLIGYGLLLLMGIVFRNFYIGTVASFFMVLFFLNYMIVQKGVTFIFPDLKYWHIVPIGIVVIIHITCTLKNKVKQEILQDTINISTLVIGVLILINFLPSIPKIVEKTNINKGATVITDSGTKQEKSNIYWLLFDEAASFETIKQYYGYDPEIERLFLRNLGFNISETSSNDCGNTHAVLTNCLNLEYIVSSEMDYAEMEAYLYNPAMVKVLNEQGYTINGIGDTNWLNINSITSRMEKEAQTVEGYNMKGVILANSVFKPFFEFNGTKSAKLIRETLDYLQDKENIKKDQAQFNFMYLCCPHQPFLFDENGDDVAAANYNNWDDDQYYLGQYKFTMKEMMKIITNIIENDPNSIIVIESDHGPRFKAGIPEDEKLRVLNSVYYKGIKDDSFEGKSAVNTWRLLFNKEFGYSFKEVEVGVGE